MAKREQMIRQREARYASMREAAIAANVSTRLLEIIEMGGETVPEIAEQIGAAYGLDAEQIAEITCPAVLARRRCERAMTPTERRYLYNTLTY